jgi:hypothetical protein
MSGAGEQDGRCLREGELSRGIEPEQVLESDELISWHLSIDYLFYLLSQSHSY